MSVFAPISQVLAAGTLTTASVSLSDPRPGTSANYTVSWKAATTATLNCVLYKVTNTAIGSTVPTGFVSTGAANGTFTNLTGTWTPTFTTNGTIKEVNSASPPTVSAGTQVTTVINTITNTTTVAGETDFVSISSYTDAGCSVLNDTVEVAIVTTPGVLISATVNPTLTFTVAGLGNGATVKGAITTEAAGAGQCATSTATAVSFPSNMVANTNYTCGQSLTTSTNAQSGYSVYLRGTHASGDFLKGTPTTLTITDGTGTNAAPAAFGTPTEEFAYTSSDAVLSSGTVARFAADDTFAKVGNSAATAEEVAFNATSVSAQVINIGYKIRFSGTTEASTYTGTVLYTCTATF